MQQSAQPLLVGAVLGGSAAAVYGITQCSIVTANLLVTRLGGAFLPSFTHLFGEGRLDRCRQVIQQFSSANALLASLVMGGILAFNQAFVGLWVGPELYAGDHVTALLVLCAIADAFMGVPYSTVFAGGGFRQLSRIMVISAPTQVAVTLGLLSFGLWGAAAGALCGSLLRLGLMTYHSRQMLASSEHAEARHGEVMGRTLRLLAPGVVLGLVIAIAPTGHIEDWKTFVLGALGFLVAATAVTWMIGRRQLAFILTKGQVGMPGVGGGAA